MARVVTERNEACLGCIYFSVTTLTCDYILMTDNRRPCPPGKGCTARSAPIKKKLTASGKLDRDVIVYFLQHTETTEQGKTKAKTVGKMIDSKLTLEGLFSIVLMCEASKDGYSFVTQSDGYTTCKSPMGMFEERIDNDLAMVDATIRDYWALDGTSEPVPMEDY